MVRAFLLLMVFSCVTSRFQAQQGVHSKMKKSQGTAEFTNVHNALRDSSGNLWFVTTGEGVYCYNGQTFKNYTVADGLNDNLVWCVLQDRSGNLWFGTKKGICRYDGKNFKTISTSNGGSFFPVSVMSTDPLADHDVWSILEDRSGKLWFGTAEGVLCYDGRFFKPFLSDTTINSNGLRLKDVQCLLQDRNGNIWFGSGPMSSEGLCRFDGKTISSFKPGGEVWIRYLFEDPKGIIWLSTRHQGLWQYDGKQFSPFGKDKSIGLAFLLDSKGNLWLSGAEKQNSMEGEGLWRFNGSSLKHFTRESGLGFYSIWSLVEDKNGYIWAGTRNNELFRYDPATESFSCFSE